MVKYTVKRCILMIPVILGVTALIFILLSFVPGDPAKLVLGNEATGEMVAAKREEMGLNDPYVIRLLRYIGDVFTKGDFGTSYYNSASIASEIMARLPRTMTIAFFGILLTMAIGIPLGGMAAVHQNGIADRVCMIFAMIGVALPEFCIAMILVTIFASKLHLLPSHGVSSWACYIMPIVAASLGSITGLARHCRNSTLEAIRSDYVTTARSKGVKEWKVIVHHVLPNSLIPVITSLGGSFAQMMGGAIVIENVFSIPGMGQYIVTAINSRDYNIIQGSVVVLAIIFSIIMLLVDLLYAAIDPRIKAQYMGTGRRKKTQ